MAVFFFCQIDVSCKYIKGTLGESAEQVHFSCCSFSYLSDLIFQNPFPPLFCVFRVLIQITSQFLN